MKRGSIRVFVATLLLCAAFLGFTPQNAFADAVSDSFDGKIEALVDNASVAPDASEELVSGLDSYEEAEGYLNAVSANQLPYLLVQAELIDGTAEYSIWAYAEPQISADGTAENGISLYANASFEDTLLSAWGNLETWIDVSSFGIAKEDFLGEYSEVIGKHPDYFNVRSAYSFPATGWDGTIKPAYLTANVTEYKSMKTKYEAQVSSALATVPSSASQLTKVYKLHNWLVAHASYDYSAINTPKSYPSSFTPYGCMVERSGVCQGYMLALADLLKRSNITYATLFVVTSNHAWNMVKIDGSWYHIDSTWDDTDSSYKYFMLSDSSMNALGDSIHKNWQDSANFGWDSSMVASNTKYDNYDWSKFESASSSDKDSGTTSGTKTTVTTNAMYRLYNPNSGEHFYTADTAERDNLKRAGWKYEGIGWTAPASSKTPVYRLYSGTDHHYTISTSERDYLIKAGWKSEGIGWYSDDAKGVAVYRQFNPNVNPKAKRNNSGSHNYTTSKVENDNLVKLGWRGEGIGWYGVK